MLSNASVHTTLPVVDIKRARRFYEEKLGLKVVMEDPSPGLTLEAGNGCQLYLYQRSMTKADHTVAEFEVADVEAEVKALREKGVTFENYDMPNMGIKTINGIATMKWADGETKSAWFKDTEGNILALGEMHKMMQKKMPQMAGSARA